MYTVPFIAWVSDSWNATHPHDFQKALDRRYSTSHFIHTWSDLAGLYFDGFDPTKSLVIEKFKEYPLLVGDPYGSKPLTDLRSLMPKPEDKIHAKK
jgi:heptose-I-phosphate ethanolaminephosphotransferase